jgi:vitamin B12 transporter
MFKFRLAQTIVCVYVCVCCSQFSLLAQQIKNSQILPEVEITAPKYPTKLSRTGKVVTIVTQEQIQAAFGKNLAELLQEQVGLSIVGSRSAPGSNQEVYLRGANTGHVLVLMDGFPINDPSHISGVWDWNLVNLSSLERIEILKGGQSTLYGSDAMAGVINLVSKKSDVKKLQTQVQLLAGGFGTFSPQIQFRGKVEKFQWKVFAKDFYTKGFSAADVKDGEKDGLRQQNLDLSLSRPLGQKSWFDVSYQLQNYRGNLDAGPFKDELDFTSKASSSSFRFQFQHKLEKVELFFRGFTDVIDRNFKNDSGYVAPKAYSKYSESNFKGYSKGLELYSKIHIGPNAVGIIGVEFRNQSTKQTDFSISSLGRYDSPAINDSLANQSILAVYATFQKNWNNQFGLELGSRWNHQSTFGNFTTFNFNPYWLITPQLKFFTNVSMGFKVPSLYQLFSPYGNLKLVPEKGTTYELGLDYQKKNWAMKVVLFENQVRDGIVFQSKAVQPFGEYVNVAKQHTQGVEAEVGFTGQKWSTHVNYTLLTGSITNKIAGKDTIYNSLIRRPKNAVTWRISYSINQFLKISLMNQWLDSRLDYVYDEKIFSVVPKDLAAYLWTDLQMMYQVSSKVRIGMILKNAFDQKIDELYGYTGQRRNLQMTLGITW